MSLSTPPPGAYQIDVVDQSGRAYRTVFENARLVGEMALLPFLILIATTLFTWIVPGGGFGGVVLALVVQLIAFLVFGTVFIVRWHRFVLLGETIADGLFPPGWAAFLTAAVKLGGLVFAGWVVLALVAVLPPHFFTLPLAAMGGVGLTLLAVRVVLIFPAAALGWPVGLGTAWRWTAGNFWRLFVCLMVCYLPFVIAGYIVAKIGAAFPPMVWILFEALRLALTFAGIAVVATLLSQLYREMVADGADSLA